jgi:hypothetical protein
MVIRSNGSPAAVQPGENMTQPPNGGPAEPPSGAAPHQDPAQPAAPVSPAAQHDPTQVNAPTSPATTTNLGQSGTPTGLSQPAAGPIPPDGGPQPAPQQGWQPPAPQAGWQPPTPPAGGPPPGDQTIQYGQPGVPPGHPGAGYPAPGYPPPGYPAPAYPPFGEPPKKRRGLMIASIVVAVVLLLCGGGGTAAFLVLRNTETGEGAAEPVAAVEDFLTAVYTDKDATKAASLVCAEARDKKAITKKVREVQNYATEYKSPRFKWTSPKVENEGADTATVSTKLTMTTGDEKTTDQQLKFTVIQKTGWWVCEVA